LSVVDHGGQLPDLSTVHINLYAGDKAQTPLAAELAGMVRQAYAMG